MAVEAQIKINIDSQGAQKSIDTLQKDLVATRQELDRMIKTYGENSKEADKLRRSVAGLEIELNQLGVATDEAVASNQSLKAELRQVTQELQKLEPGSARFVELSNRAGQLRDQIQDTNAVVGALAGNFSERLFGGISSVVTLGVAGFQGFQSILALTGTESKELQETMVRLQALMNLSQVAQTFAGLPDELTKIKAAFGSLTVATQAQNVAQTSTAVSAGATAVAMEGEAVAAAGAATSTGVFGAALSALPLVGIVAAIGTVVYGLVQYANASGQTAEEKEKQRKETEALNEKIKEENIRIGENAGAYLPLIFQLKNTNANSKERKALINEINSTYGTTFKNLKDETAFQSQLNISIKEYIALQVLKARAQSKEKEQAAAIGELIKAQDALKKVEEEYAGKTEQQIRDYDLKKYGVSVYRDAINRYTFELEQAQKKAEEYTISQNDLQKEIDKLTNTGKKYEVQTNTNTNTVVKATEETDKYAGVLEKANNLLERRKAIVETTQQVEDRKPVEQRLKDQQSIIDFYSQEQNKIRQRAIASEIKDQEEKFKKQGKTEEAWLKKRQEIESNWTKYAIKEETDLFYNLGYLRDEEIKNLTTQYDLKDQIVTNATEQILTNTRYIELEFQKKKDLEDLNNAVLTEEQKEKKILEINRKYANAEIQMLKDLQTKKQTQLDLELQQTLSNEEKSALEKEQAQAKYSDDTIKLAQETADKINEINKGIKDPLPDTKSVEEKANELYAKISEYVDKVSALYGQLSDVIQQQAEYQFSVREFNMNKLYEDEVNKLDESLRKQEISQEQYNAEKERADQELKEKEKQLKKDQFETNKRLGIANAFISGAQAVLQALAGSPPPLNFILAGITTGLVGAQIAVIGNQQFQAATGGIVPGDGSKNIDSVSALLAPGEAVINAQSTSMFPDLISSINEAGGGKKLTPNLPPRSNPQQTPNVFGNGQQQNQVVKAYVVETDITDTQKRINRIKQSVEF